MFEAFRVTWSNRIAQIIVGLADAFDETREYERFTDRARKIMHLADQESMRLKHAIIGTEHILLGLAAEGAGVAAHALKYLDVDLPAIQIEIEKMLLKVSAPELTGRGRRFLTPRAKLVLRYATEEARNLNHNYIGTEHLLLGLLRENEGVAAQVLINLGLKLEDVRHEVLAILGHA